MYKRKRNSALWITVFGLGLIWPDAHHPLFPDFRSPSSLKSWYKHTNHLLKTLSLKVRIAVSLSILIDHHSYSHLSIPLPHHGTPRQTQGQEEERCRYVVYPSNTIPTNTTIFHPFQFHLIPPLQSPETTAQKPPSHLNLPTANLPNQPPTLPPASSPLAAHHPPLPPPLPPNPQRSISTSL